VHRRRREAQGRHDAVVHHAFAAGDGAEGQLGMARHAELARDEDVELAADGLRQLEGDGHPAARQGQNEGVLPRQPPQPGGQLAPRLPSVAEQRRPHRRYLGGPAG